MYKILLSLLIFAFSFTTQASHIVGGELKYECEGVVAGSSNPVLYRFKITQILYRDCGGVSFSGSINVNIWNYNGVNSGPIILVGQTISNIPLILNGCSSTNSSVCIQKREYLGFINLPSSPGGYTLQTQQCCRNASAANILAPSNTDASYVTKITSPNSINCNSNPVFKNDPIIAFCKNDTVIYDHSAIDIDGDSLSYHFAKPYSGGSNGPPPYSLVDWKQPYTTNMPLDGFFTLNNNTGEIVINPSTIGNYIVGIEVKEWRNGVLINSTMRDFQYYIVDCFASANAIIPNQTRNNNEYACVGKTVTFGNESLNGTTYKWDFGVINSISDTSDLEFPTFTFPDTGKYTIKLTINENTICEHDTTIVYDIQPALFPDFNLDSTACINNNSFDFIASGVIDSSATYSWDFGITASLTNSTNMSEFNISYQNTGTKNIQLDVSQYGCTKTVSKMVEIVAEPNANFTAVHNTLAVTFNPDVATNTVSTYSWMFGDGNSSTQSNPTHTYLLSGTYTVSLSVSNACGTKITSQQIDVKSTGIGELTQAIFSLYPNPAANVLTIDLKNNSLSNNAEIIDNNGRLVKTIALEKDKTKVDVSELSDGIYIVKLMGSNATLKFIVKK